MNPDFISDLNLFALVGAVLAGFFILWSEYYYLRSIWRRESNPNPITWLIWSMGAWILVVVEWNNGVHLNTFYLATIAVCTTAIFLLSTILGKGKKYIGKTEFWCLAIGVVGAYIGYTHDAPHIAFIAALTIDITGALPTYKSARRRPQDEPLLPWKLTCLSALLNLLSVVALFTVGNEGWYALIFGTYYLVANFLILSPLLRYYRSWIF